MAGPAIDADCHASEFHAIARGRCSRGTSIGPSAVLAGEKNARDEPNSSATQSSSVTDAKCRNDAATRMVTATLSPA